MTDPFSPIIPWLVWIIPLIGAMLIPLIAKIGNNIRNISAVLFSFISALLAGLMLLGVFSGWSSDKFRVGFEYNTLETTLREEAVKSGLVNAKDYAKLVNPKNMTKPK